ncbi:heterokaryon incompatibility protein-domain-containing protein [Pyrenochaeta sp. MPI-SDFR-AT-0127]|nr:heterokaryon incompatibility protein-domain-containing protein [Pyrenochaeta sp. MPI-SDFR-AT-0127]
MSVYTGNYAALSYVWGKPEYTHKILVGENYLAITPNLHAALLRLRDSTAAKKLWVDAICINQADDEERAAQVEGMAQIYAFADHVLVWLGPQAEDSDAAFRTIESAAGRAGDLETYYSAAVHVDNIKGENLNLPIPEATVLNSLLKRPYFGRIWILQELAAARKSVILCGPQEMDGTVFCKGIRELKAHSQI